MSWLFANKDRCYRGGKMHNYTPRYSEKHADQTRIQVGDMFSTSDSFNRALAKIYVRDVCTWCGATIELPKETK